MTGNPQDKVVLITGAARRIGAAIAQKFHEQEYNVLIHCKDSLEEADRLAILLNQKREGSALALQADLTREDQVARLADQAVQAFNRLDVLINNASSFYPTPLGEVTAAHWNYLLDSNLRGAFFLSQALAGALGTQRGAIINLLDIYAEQPLHDYPVYSIAKAGLQAMTRSLAVELAPEVRVNGVAPGAILWSKQEKDTNAEPRHESILASIPLGRTGNTQDIAEAVFFLAAEASYITGEVLRVDGGRRLNL